MLCRGPLQAQTSIPRLCMPIAVLSAGTLPLVRPAHLDADESCNALAHVWDDLCSTLVLLCLGIMQIGLAKSYVSRCSVRAANAATWSTWRPSRLPNGHNARSHNLMTCLFRQYTRRDRDDLRIIQFQSCDIRTTLCAMSLFVSDFLFWKSVHFDSVSSRLVNHNLVATTS